MLPDADEGGDGEKHGGEGGRDHKGDAVDHVAREGLWTTNANRGFNTLDGMYQIYNIKIYENTFTPQQPSWTTRRRRSRATARIW